MRFRRCPGERPPKSDAPGRTFAGMAGPLPALVIDLIEQETFATAGTYEAGGF